MLKKKQKLSFLILVLLGIAAVSSGSIAQAEPELRQSTGQTIYLPIYSHIYSGDKEYPFPLAATISIRNTDLKNSITILAVDFYGPDGKLIRSYLKTPVKMERLTSIRYVVKESDKSGGSGANFIVKWASDAKVNPPIVESIMIGTRSQQGLSFTSRGQVIEEK
jgi:hypothetical protein